MHPLDEELLPDLEAEYPDEEEQLDVLLKAADVLLVLLERPQPKWIRQELATTLVSIIKVTSKEISMNWVH